jgi:glutamate 5-kinase
MLLVTSGAVAAGKGVYLRHLPNGNVLPSKQILAAIGQSRLMQVYEEEFNGYGIPTAQALLSHRDVYDRIGYLNLRSTLSGLLEHRIVPVINENDVVAIDELSDRIFGDNDNLSALVTNIVDGDLLIILGQVEGMFTRDPNIYEDAKIIPVVERLEQISEVSLGPSSDSMGRGGMFTKLDAAKLATSSGADVVIASGYQESVISRLVRGEKIGTFFHSSVTKLESRKRWMLSSMTNKASIIVDDGASAAILNNHSSLLPAGIVRCRGDFDRGEIISICNIKEERLAIGIVNYKSGDVENIKGLKSDSIESVLAFQLGDEVVHRDNMVLG